MRRTIVAGNWKMNGTRDSIQNLVSKLKTGARNVQDVDIIVFPSFPFLPEVEKALNQSNIQWGAQNVYEQERGAYTGEVSPAMLSDFNCTYVLVGHSERRHLLGETNEQVGAKFILAGKYKLKPVLCVGETQQERDDNRTNQVIMEQLDPILSSEEGLEVLQDAVIAYEPVWAIGTGKTPTAEEAQDVHKFIRKQVAKHDKSLAEKVRILYGGSVKKDNAKAFFLMPDIDGGLIGGASLDAEEFLEIVKQCN